MTRTWTAKTAAEATGGITAGEWSARGVTIDSRILKPGELYVAIHGERVNGHQFTAHAFEQGAAAALVHEDIEAVDRTRLLRVDNTMEALPRLAAYARAHTRTQIVGVTGSVGKTSAKEMLRLALSACGETYASSGNFNNHIGLPLNVANLNEEAEFAVFEMGMNHAGEIDFLTRIARPHVAMITNVEAVHLEFFKDVQGIADAKSEIFNGLEPEGSVVLNRDNRYFDHCMKRAAQAGVSRVLSFGNHREADCRVLDIQQDAGAEGTMVNADIAGQSVRFTIGATGAHWGELAVGVLTVVYALGADIHKAAESLAEFHEVKGRGKITPLCVGGGNAWLIDDSYNASPAAMRAAIAKLSGIHAKKGRGKTIAVLGDMFELGDTAPALHAELAESLKAHSITQVYTAGTLMAYLFDALPATMRGIHGEDAAALIAPLIDALEAGDTILIKGSNGMKMSAIVDALQSETEGAHNAV